MKTQVIVVENYNERKFFFSSKHSSFDLGDCWVPTTFYLPMKVTPRPSLPSGVVATKEDVRTVFCEGETEIPNIWE